MDALIWWAAAPTPTPTVNPDDVTPGVAGFIAVGVLAAAVVLLLMDMLRRIRRARYRSEIGEELDAEIQASAQADGDRTAPEADRPDGDDLTRPAKG